jgi:hypothetical protein
MNHEEYSNRPVNAQDIPWIIKLWEKFHGHENLAFFPGTNVSQWNNHGLNCCAVVILKKGQPIGYARYVKHNNPLEARELLNIALGL